MFPNKSAEETELDQEETALRAEAESIDPARPEDAGVPDVPSEAEERAAASGEATPEKRQRPGSDKQPDAAGAAKPDASKGNQQPKDGSQKPAAKDKQTQQQDQQKPADKVDESKLTPFQKERRRLDDTWKRVESRKSELDQREQALAARERALAEQQQKATATPKKSEGITAADYEAIAKDYEAEGKLKLADQARAKAADLRKEESSAPAADAGPRKRFSDEEVATMTQQWQGNLVKAAEENPDLNQEGTPLRTRVVELLKTVPLLHMSGDGILYAVEYAKSELQAKRVPELEAKVADLEKEVQRLTGLTSLPSGGATPPATAQKFEELSLDDQEQALREEAAGQVAG
jgi:hypothetical protein